MEERGVVEVEAMDAESVEPEVERYVQFIFDAKMVEFRVPWTQEQLANAVTKVMADDGYMWVPQDEERGTGAFVNLNNCTNIKLLEREVVKELAFEPDVAQEELTEFADVEMEDNGADFDTARRFLDRIGKEYNLPLGGSIIHGNRDDKFIMALLCECLGMSDEDAERAIVDYRDLM